MLVTLRSLSSFVSIFLPIIFIIVGVLMCSLTINGDDAVFLYVKRYVMSYFMVWAFVFNTSAYCGSIVLER